MTIPAIREFLKQPDCVIFVGSGISTWSGIPNWSSILRELASFLEEEGQSSELVRRELRGGDLLQAASYGVSRLTPASFGKFIRKAVRFGSATPHKIHKAIVELGPNGFITTNYDTLIEQALGRWRAAEFFPEPVTNKHLVELADVIGARSSHFIFKPHGDINDVSSIILTREQYRTLIPGGERHNALEALKTLLVTRPIFYLGFGLRDPDFIYLRDLLLNIYQGAVLDHWAIMPDVGEEEVDYWRNQYGIKLVGYETYEYADGSRDHRDLFPFIEALSTPDRTFAAPVRDDNSDTARILALTRYTSGLVRRLAPTSSPIEVRISETRARGEISSRLSQYEGWTTTRFLTEGPHPAYLIGLPGSGKSFAIRLAALQLATKLQQACLEDTLATTALRLPIVLDLKLYQGDLHAQIAAELPAGFSLDTLRGALGVMLFLDAFNEMPSEHLEDDSLFRSLEVLKDKIGQFEYVITSRTSDGFPRRPGGATFYEIDRFERRYVDAVLADNGITLSGRFAEDTHRLLSRPFFLQLVAKRLVELPVNATPRDLFASFMTNLEFALSERFATSLRLLPIFAKVAYRAIECDNEAFPLAWFYDLAVPQIPSDAGFSASDVVNWLIARQVLIPYTGHRASFIHQSITEYCAANELARRSRNDTMTVHDTIASKKWDQCLFLALALMERETAEAVLKEALEADLYLAINAARYAEEGQSAIVVRILNTLINRIEDNNLERISLFSLDQLPAGPEHIELLRQLLPSGGIIAAQAVLLITEVLGVQFKSELLDLLETHASDYNFAVNGIARALGPLLTEADLARLITIAERWLEESGDDATAAVSDLLAHFHPQDMIRAARAVTGEIAPGMANVLADALGDRNDDDSFALLIDLLLAYPKEATSAFALALVGEDDRTTRYRLLDQRHIEAIWSARSEELWDDAISRICHRRIDLKMYVAVMAEARKGVEKIALLYCSGSDDEELFALFEELLKAEDEVLQREPFEIFRLRHLDWRGREALLVRAMARDVPKLCRSLLTSSYDDPALTRGSVDLAVTLPTIESVLRSAHNDGWWMGHLLGLTVAYLGNSEVRDFCLGSLVSGPESLKDWVKQFYLGADENLTSDALDDDMIAVLLADLNVAGRISEFFYNPLGSIATDRFVQERLLPLAQGASPIVQGNIIVILKAVGNRFGKRYMLPK